MDTGWMRLEDLLNFLPDHVPLFLACVPLQDDAEIAAQWSSLRSRQPGQPSPWSTFLLHQPGTFARQRVLDLDNCEPCLPAMELALSTTTRWVFLLYLDCHKTESQAQAERGTTEHLDGATVHR